MEGIQLRLSAGSVDRIRITKLNAKVDSYEFAIQYMYGFEFTAIRYLPMPHTLSKLAEVATIAQRLEIPGLFELAYSAAVNALVEILRLEDETKLQAFLAVTTWKFASADRQYCDVAYDILAEYHVALKKTSTYPEFLKARNNVAYEISMRR